MPRARIAYLYRKAMTTQPLWLGVLDAVAKAANWQPRVSNSVKQTGHIVTGRGISIAGETHLMSDVYSAAVAEVDGQHQDRQGRGHAHVRRPGLRA